uniref:Uncharacterized protein n=1 Tax=Podoviridae sp. ctaNW81 TaxID=2826562 RepID=A0A8S5M5I7_9CAUD|nr:MAG TPA: hypothetical protein [Podoviridae sp. ctaNW81]
MTILWVCVTIAIWGTTIIHACELLTKEDKL